VPLIHRVKISRINPDLSTSQIMVFRMGGEQADAEAFGNLVRTKWMEANPGWPTTMVTDWPTSDELGMKWSVPERGEHFYTPF
jgi:hypothetical protein